MKALTWKEPFCTLMGFGKYETRTWPTKVRGHVLMCSGQRSYTLSDEIFISGAEQFNRISTILQEAKVNMTTTLGKAMFVGILVECRLMTKEDEEKCFVRYREPWTDVKINKKTGEEKVVVKKLWVHIYEDVRPIVPFDWRGKQGWSDVPDDLVRKIIYK